PAACTSGIGSWPWPPATAGRPTTPARPGSRPVACDSLEAQSMARSKQRTRDLATVLPWGNGMRVPMGVDGPRRPARHPVPTVFTLILGAEGLAVSWMDAGCSQPVAGAGAPDSAAHPVRPPPGPAAPLRLATFNIRWGLGADGVRDLTRTAAVLRAMDADIVLLNEVDVHWRRSGNKDQPAYLAQAAGYPYMYFGPALRTWASGGPRLSLYGNLL